MDPRFIIMKYANHFPFSQNETVPRVDVSCEVLMQILEKDFQVIIAANDGIMMISGNED